MPDYTIRDPKTGRTVTVRGPSPPTDAEIDRIMEATAPPSLQDVGNVALADNPALGWAGRAGLGMVRKAWEDPVATGATVGALAAAPFTGGASIPAAMGATALGAAGGAGWALAGQQLIDAVTGRAAPKTVAGNIGTMATHGAAAAAGEGGGRAAIATGKWLVPMAARKLLNPGWIEREFPSVVDDFIKERVPIGRSARADTRMQASADEVKALLAEKDAQQGLGYRRPPGPGTPQVEPLPAHSPLGPTNDISTLPGNVRGLLTEGTEAVPMGTPSISETPGMPGKLFTPQTFPLRRPPPSTMPEGGRFAEHIPGVDPVEEIPSSWLTTEGRPPVLGEASELAGAGTQRMTLTEGDQLAAQLRRKPAKDLTQDERLFLSQHPKSTPGRGAYPGQVGAEEVALPLAKVRGDLMKRGIKSDPTKILDSLKRKFFADNPRAMTLVQAHEMKQAEQGIAHNAFKAAANDVKVGDVPALFHKGLATGAKNAIERQVPAVAPMNARTQKLFGLLKSLEQAEERTQFSLNPLNSPTAMSHGVFLGDTVTKGLQTTGARSGQQLLAQLAAILMNSDQSQGGR